MVDENDGAEQDPAIQARGLMRSSIQVALGTLAADSGEPYASLALCACDYDATPLLLLSTLAVHTNNIAADPRVSLLFDGTGDLPLPLTGKRVSVQGQACKSELPRHRARYLAQHPKTGMFAGFADFGIYEIKVTRAHLVAGFGKAGWLSAEELLLRDSLTRDDGAWETVLLTRLNRDRQAEIDAIAQQHGGAGEGWSITGFDGEGCALTRGSTRLRLDFRHRAAAPEALEDSFFGLLEPPGPANG